MSRAAEPRTSQRGALPGDASRAQSKIGRAAGPLTRSALPVCRGCSRWEWPHRRSAEQRVWLPAQ